MRGNDVNHRRGRPTGSSETDFSMNPVNFCVSLYANTLSKLSFWLLLFAFLQDKLKKNYLLNKHTHFETCCTSCMAFISKLRNCISLANLSLVNRIFNFGEGCVLFTLTQVKHFLHI